MMDKVTRRFRPADYWRIGEHESWFSDMAAQGLHLAKMGFWFAHFTKGEPESTRYRIEISMNRKKLSQEQIQFYAESGWDYVTNYGNFHVFSSPLERNVPELHTDPVEQSYTLKELDRKHTKNALLVVATTILMLAWIFLFAFIGDTPVLSLVEGFWFQQVIASLTGIYVAVASLQAALSIRALRKTLAEGKAVNHDAPWKKHYRVSLITGFLFISLAMFSVVLPWVHIARSETKTLPETGTDLPIVRLADVEQNPQLARKQSYLHDNIDWGNRYSYDWSLLAPIQYQADEHGVVPDAVWKDGSGEYSPSIRSSVYQLRLPQLGEVFVNDLVKRYGMVNEGEIFSEVEHAGFDLLIVHEREHAKEVFVLKGKGVMHVRYFGQADLEAIIENTAQKIGFISE
jgi:hypothetical protein